MSQPIILAIDTSCDETAAAVSCGRRILSNVISSQINIHAKWSGVVPHLAKRAHLEKIEPMVKKALVRFGTIFRSLRSLQACLRRQAAESSEPSKSVGSELSVVPKGFGTSASNLASPMYIGPSSEPENLNRIDAIAVTIGPGLAPALEVGVNYAKKLALKYKKPLIAINHMEGHLLSSLALNSKGKGSSSKLQSSLVWLDLFPAIGLLVSGGHTQLVLVKKIGNYQLLGETLDDAGGEALDKLAKMLKLGYPGGPIIEQLAKKGDPNAIDLPVPIRYSKDFNFSFSGLKTAALYKIKPRFGTSSGLQRVKRTKDSSEPSNITKQYTHNMAASFQQAIAISLTTKLSRAIKEYQPKSILLGGGVISNIYIRSQIRKAVKPFNLPLYLPYSKKLFTDNAAMICIPAYYKFLKKDFVKNIETLDRQPNLNF